MKHFFTLFFLVVVSAKAQIAHYNQFPSLAPSHVLDAKLTDISFAFSMRVLVSDYNGPLVRLRKDSDNTLEDFYAADNDIVDVNAITTWASGANLYIHTWYDQSDLGRNAIQTNTTFQPRFYPDPAQPYFEGDGTNDFLEINTPNGIQDLTNNGNQATILTILKATNRQQFNFGVYSNSGANRWSAHLNWDNSSLYFDPGNNSGNRSYSNSNNANLFKQYTLIKTETRIIMRDSGIERVNTSRNTSTNLRLNFRISAANSSPQHANTPFLEFIMYKTNISSDIYEKIEKNQITFWDL